MAKIYVGTYEKYNNGSIAGAWLDCEDYADYADFIEACKKLHKDESDPELMFQDFEEFPTMFYKEYAIDPRLWDYLTLDESDRGIVNAWLSENPLSDSEDLQSIVDSFTGRYDSWADYAEEITRACHNIPDHLEYYIDWEKMGRDMLLEHCGYVEYDGEIWMFENR